CIRTPVSSGFTLADGSNRELRHPGRSKQDCYLSCHICEEPSADIPPDKQHVGREPRQFRTG
ncbi:hypothetical protein KXV85_005339, partial [Aspergillus fumigatus]